MPDSGFGGGEFEQADGALQEAWRRRDTGLLWKTWSRTFEEALLRAAEPSRIEEAGGIARFRGRGRTRITLSDLKPPAPRVREDGILEEDMQCGKVAGARRIARTLAAVGCRLRVASWTTDLATEFVGAVRRPQRLDRSVVFVGLLAAAADYLRGHGRGRAHPLLEG